MIILVDTREQRALKFNVNTIRKGLKFGDYGALFSDQYQCNVVFERKSKADLFGSLTKGYDRLRNVFKRAEDAKFKLIIAIECTKEDVLLGYEHSKRDPQSILKQLETINNKYGVESVFFDGRKDMAQYIVDYFLKLEKEYLKIEE